MQQIHVIPAFTDNYFWLIQPDIQLPDCFIVDPGDAKPVFDYLEHHELQPKGILITHHHHDHIDGVASLVNTFDLPVYGPKSPAIPQVTHYVKEGDELPLGGLKANILALPGHTMDHIAYLIAAEDGTPLLFSGDTLFAAGCGRLFDGTAPLLYAALQKISALPDNTLIYAAHEYTLANIRFALTIEPHNADLLERQKVETRRREQYLPTLPTVLSLEKRTNPFLRCHLSTVKHAVESLSGHKIMTTEEIFASLRRAKDQF